MDTSTSQSQAFLPAGPSTFERAAKDLVERRESPRIERRESPRIEPRESVRPLESTPINELGLAVHGSVLEPMVEQVCAELGKTLKRLRPHFYLSTEWGVPFGSISVGVPFYLARAELRAIHAQCIGHVEGATPADLLKYLRHEVGHVVNYAFRLYDQEEWVAIFGSLKKPYEEDYRPEPFAPGYVTHLPGWYAQKHPDEDWAETFAVWLTPGADWRKEYADRPEALGKLLYCDQIMKSLADVEPVSANEDLDDDVSELRMTVDQFYASMQAVGERPFGFDAALKAAFDELAVAFDANGEKRSAAALIRHIEPDLMNNVFRWTGHFPERTRLLTRHLSERAEDLQLVYPAARESEAQVAVATFVSTLAMNFVYRGTYTPGV